MFTIGQKVVDQNGKVFVVSSIEGKDFGKGREDYLTLRPCFEEEFSKGYCSYVPLSSASSLIRLVMSKKQVKELACSYEDLEPRRFKNPRERKTYFENVVKSKDSKERLRAIKSLVLYREERKASKKVFSDFDRMLLDRLSSLLKSERAAALDLSPEEVSGYIQKKIRKEKSWAAI